MTAWTVYVALAAVGFTATIVVLAVLAWTAGIVERAHRGRHEARRRARQAFPFGDAPAGRHPW